MATYTDRIKIDASFTSSRYKRKINKEPLPVRPIITTGQLWPRRKDTK